MRNLQGLAGEVCQYLAWKLGIRATDRARSSIDEASFWDEANIERIRKASWSNAGHIHTWAFNKMCGGKYGDLFDLLLATMASPPARPARGLVLGCGDMVAEHTMFLDPRLPIDDVDAYDLSPASIEKARALTNSKGLRVNYTVADVNRLALPADAYTLVVVFHSYHHFEKVGEIAAQINHALRPEGVFVLSDYIGPRQLQFTPAQKCYAQRLSDLLPENYRRALDGKIRGRIESVPVNRLSPDEAIMSDRILGALSDHLQVRWQYNWAGLLYPLLEGIAFNFSMGGAEAEGLLRLLFDLDFALCQSGAIEPSFTFTVATKRS